MLTECLNTRTIDVRGQDILPRWAVTVQIKVTETPFDVTTFLIMHVVKLEVLERQFDKI